MISLLENKLLSISNLKFRVLIIIFAAVRVGVSPIGKDWFGWLLDAAQSFPEATSYISYSPIPVILLKALGTSSPYVWWFLWLFVYFGWLIICLLLIDKKFRESARVLQLIFIMSQSVMINMTIIGHYDNLIFMAGTLLLFFVNNYVYFFTAFLIGGANPNIGFASGVCFMFYYFYSKKSQHLRISLTLLFVSSIYLVGTNIWFTPPKSGTRETIVLGQISEVIKGSLGVWWFIPLTVLGPLTAIYFWLIFIFANTKSKVSKIKVASLILSTFIIPTLMAFFILDHTRVGVAAGGIVSLVFIFENYATIRERVIKYEIPILSILIIIWVLTPPVMIDSGGVFRLPYLKYIEL